MLEYLSSAHPPVQRRSIVPKPWALNTNMYSTVPSVGDLYTSAIISTCFLPFCHYTFIAQPYVLYMQAVKQQYPDSSYDVAAPVHFRFNSPEDGHSDPQSSICIKFELNPTEEWMLAEKNAGQVCILYF